MRTENLTGQVFGSYTVIGPAGTTSGRKKEWLVKCIHGEFFFFTRERIIKNASCRHLKVKAHTTDYNWQQKQIRVLRLKLDPTLRPHGLLNTYYNWGCKCPPCKKVGSEDNKKRNARRKQLGLPTNGGPSSRKKIREATFSSDLARR